ncbi:hypothetical protein LWI28_016264 [Acer negundo]|uniref:Uncharacterized protein n=1 Tax=Acer negundo TaxID=4023 RepID=A0AAD5JQJ1_ACENE|nr:hypothetical protein LWI28_016264 [Acer negundo]
MSRAVGGSRGGREGQRGGVVVLNPVAKNKKKGKISNGSISKHSMKTRKSGIIEEEVSKVMEVGNLLGLDFTGIEQEMSEVIASREAEDLARLKLMKTLIPFVHEVEVSQGYGVSSFPVFWRRVLGCLLQFVWSGGGRVVRCLFRFGVYALFYELQLGSCLGMYLLGSGELGVSAILVWCS